jgi:hypothetical protein
MGGGSFEKRRREKEVTLQRIKKGESCCTRLRNLPGLGTVISSFPLFSFFQAEMGYIFARHLSCKVG